ncbi:MAG: protease inhibitor I42 family protein [Clostridia bacterium]|nr:protease inhibitor I42 family protein [Clostridia bacterium]
MKKVVSLLLAMILLLNMAVFADTTAVPVLISAKLFDVTYDGDQFTITLEENPSTGYVWTYTIHDEALVKYISDETLASDSGLMGAPGQHQFTFESLENGISTISFEKKRPFEEEPVAGFEALVYKTDDTLIVEENSIVTIMDGTPTMDAPTTITINDVVLDLDVNMQVIDGVTMVPVAETLRALGYEVIWHEETQTVEILKGAQWTTITIGKNAYFKNRMAPSELSMAPVIVDNRTLVPAEFFSVMLGLGVVVDSAQLEINAYANGFYEGYVLDITYDETGTMTISLGSEETQEMADVIIHTSNAYTYKQVEIVKGEYVHVVAASFATMSIPPQTSAYVIY